MKITSPLFKKMAGFAFLQALLYGYFLLISFKVEKYFTQMPLLLLCWILLFLCYFISMQLLKKEGADASVLLLILGAGLFFRWIAFFVPPILSDDIYYYIWYGRVGAHGYNPYLFTPESPLLAFLRDDKIWGHIPFKGLSPAYPPFIMILFLAAYKIGGSSLLAFKVLQWIPEFLTLFFGVKLLRLNKQNPSWVLIYAWCPLPIIEYMGMGHTDTWGVAFLTLFLYFFQNFKIARAFVFLALATLVKWIPLLFLPLLWRYLPGKRKIWPLISFLITMGLLYLPYLSAGKNVFGLLPTYLKSWEFNSSLYRIVRLGFERADIAHGVTSVFIGAWALLVAFRKPPLIQGLLAITFFFFLFFHTVYPWYLGWLLPFLFLITSWAAYSWLFTSIFSYWVLLGYRSQGLWKENPLILILEYLPIFLLLILQWLKEKSKPLKAI